MFVWIILISLAVIAIVIVLRWRGKPPSGGKTKLPWEEDMHKYTGGGTPPA